MGHACVEGFFKGFLVILVSLFEIVLDVGVVRCCNGRGLDPWNDDYTHSLTGRDAKGFSFKKMLRRYNDMFARVDSFYNFFL